MCIRDSKGGLPGHPGPVCQLGQKIPAVDAIQLLPGFQRPGRIRLVHRLFGQLPRPPQIHLQHKVARQAVLLVLHGDQLPPRAPLLQQPAQRVGGVFQRARRVMALLPGPEQAGQRLVGKGCAPVDGKQSQQLQILDVYKRQLQARTDRSRR